jgi:uncharacterized protein (TIGR03435 family)
MPDVSDMELLRDYDRQGSEAAFAAVVHRHVNLVYSAALRHVGIVAHAEEITQAVFIILARKAASLRPDTILEGWLHETTRLTALSFLRGERRRQFREQEAYMQSTLQEFTDASTWNQLAPLLDEAIARLGKKDRDAMMLRFFKDKSLREVAAALNVNEAAAQRRVLRALEKLRKFFTKRGVSSTTAIIAGTISANSVQAAPVALAKSVAAVAIAKGATASISTLTLIKGALKIMAWTKAKSAIVAGTVVLLAAGTTTVVVNRLLPVKVDEAWFVTDSRVLDKVPDNLTVVRPTHFKRGGGGILCEPSRMVSYNMPLDWCMAYADNFSDNSRIVLPTNFPKGSFDILITRPKDLSPKVLFTPPKYRNYDPTEEIRQVLRDEVKKQFGYVARRKTREAEAFALRVKNPNMPALHKNANVDDSSAIQASVEGLNSKNFPLDSLAAELEPFLKVPVLDQTGLTNRVVLDLRWKKINGETEKDTVMRVVSDELGLEFVSTNAPVEMLVVEKVK